MQQAEQEDGNRRNGKLLGHVTKSPARKECELLYERSFAEVNPAKESYSEDVSQYANDHKCPQDDEPRKADGSY